MRTTLDFPSDPTTRIVLGILLALMFIGPAAHAMPNHTHPNASTGIRAPLLSGPYIDPDAQARQVSDRLREVLARQKARRQQAQAAQAESLPQNPALDALRQRLGNSLKLLGTQATGIPRQIKGKMLEKAALTPGARSDRDRVTAQRFLKRQRAMMQLNDPLQELQLSRYLEDELGRRHLRYRQTYQGIPVWPAEVIVHIDPDGNVDAVEGGHVASPRRSVPKPAVDRATAARWARQAVDAAPDAATRPLELIYFAQDDGQSRLAWKIELPVNLRQDWIVVVDAANGAILHVHNQVNDANVAGSGIDLLGINQQLNVWQGGNTFYLVDASKPMFDPTSTPPDNARGAIVIKDARNKPTGSNPDAAPTPTLYQITASKADGIWLKDGVSAAFNLAQTYDYYLERHGRDSIDGAKGSLNAMVRYGQNYQNAFWSNPYMVFGTADRYAAALDVVAHELTHGVTENTANLVYRSQPGALNEALSDIFGESVEARTLGHADWVMGTDLRTQIRDLKNPARFGDPAKMSDYQALSVDSNGDWGGVHTNSCIIGHAYYLLAEGLNEAIGIGASEKIFYRALSQHLVPNAQFADMRRAAVLSAEELVTANAPGIPPNAAAVTGLAFDAVEIPDSGGTTPTPTPVPPIDAADSALCIRSTGSPGSEFLCRREAGLMDPDTGIGLSYWNAQKTRPAVSGDGALGVYVRADNDICLIDTNAIDSDNCLGFPGEIASVAMSADGNRYAFVMLDNLGMRRNFITVIDLANPGNPRSYTLKAPVSEGNAGTIDYADAMDFTVDGRMLIYDAVTEFPAPGGTPPVTAWSIYALDLVNEQFLTVVPPSPGQSIGNPSVGRAGSGHLTYEKQDIVTADSEIWVANLNTNVHNLITTVVGDLGTPHFTGDDKALVFTQPDAGTPTGASLMRLPLSDDLQSATGSATLWLSDAEYGVIYRRGTFVGVPEHTLTVKVVGGGTVTSSPGGIDCGTTCTSTFLQDSPVTLTAQHLPGWELQEWTGCDSVAGTTCSVTMTGDKSPTATFKDSPMTLSVSVDGNGVVFGTPGIYCSQTDTSRCEKTYTRPKKIRLTARPGTDSVLDRWEGCETVVNQRCTVTVDSRTPVQAFFRPKNHYMLTVTTAGSGTGTVINAPSGINCGSACTASLLEGTKLRLTARPNVNSRFAGWTNCRQPVGNRCTVLMDAEKSIEAQFDAAF